MRLIIVGGLSRSLLNFRGPLLKTLVESGHEVIACAPDAPRDLRAGLKDLGVRYRHIPLARAGLKPWGDLQTLRALIQLFREERPDRVLAYTAKPVIYGCLAARGCRRPPVHAMITGLGYGFGGLSRRQRLIGTIVQGLYRMALRRAAGVMFQNPDDRDLFVASGPPLSG